MTRIQELELSSERQRDVAEMICGHSDTKTLAAEVSVRVSMWAGARGYAKPRSPDQKDSDHIYAAWNNHGLHHSELRIYGLELGTVATQREDLARQLRGDGKMRPCDEAVADQLARFGATVESSSPVHMLAAAKALYGQVIEWPKQPGDGRGAYRPVAGTGLPRDLAAYLHGWERYVPSERDAEKACEAMRAEPPLAQEQRDAVAAEFRAAEKAKREAEARREAAAVVLGHMRKDLRGVVRAATASLEDAEPAEAARVWLAVRGAIADALADAGVDLALPSLPSLPELETEAAAAAS